MNTRSFLCSRGLFLDPTCPCCGMAVEFLEHIILFISELSRCLGAYRPGVAIAIYLELLGGITLLTFWGGQQFPLTEEIYLNMTYIYKLGDLEGDEWLVI